MKKILLLIMVCCALQFSLNAQSVRKMKIEEVLHMIDTSTQPLVVNFWATWCAPCIHEIPWFEKTIAQYADKKVKLVLVSIDYPDEFPAGITAFAKKNGYRSQIIWLNETDAEVFCPKVDKSWDGTIPVTMMVNNKKHFKQFYKQQLPESRLVQELKSLVE